jgi:hypothetical protein
MYGGVWRHWWFWVAAGYLDRGLTSYCVRYWQAKGEPPPPRRYSYRLDAASLVIYTGIAVFLSIGLAAERNYLWAAVSAVAALSLARFALIRAREIVIGWSRPRDRTR